MRLPVLLLLPALYCFAAEECVPGETPVTSPRGSFKITQRMDNDSWHTTLHFTKLGGESVVFANEYPWPGRFFVSPDDQWLLQIQKSGSGDNISFFYRIEASGRIWRMEEELGGLAFRFLEHTTGLAVEHLYHTGIGFVLWDMKANLLRFSIHGSSGLQGIERVEREMDYDFKKHTFRAVKT